METDRANEQARIQLVGRRLVCRRLVHLRVMCAEACVVSCELRGRGLVLTDLEPTRRE